VLLLRDVLFAGEFKRKPIKLEFTFTMCPQTKERNT
jgi:hypothetical protein